MEPFRYQLTFDSAFVPAGADAAENAIRRVGDEASRATRTAVSNDSAIQRVMSDNAAKAKVSEFAYYDLDAAIRRTKTSGQAYAQNTTQMARGSANASRGLLALSQGFEDAQYGIRGVLNNIPTLIMSLGGTAGLAGALSIAAVAGSLLWEWLGKTEAKASESTERLKEFGEKAQQIKSDKIAEMTQGLWDAWDAADATRQKFEETKKASDSYSTAALSNSEKIRQAEQLVAEVLGIQVDRFRELEQVAQIAAQKRDLAAQQEIRRQQELIAQQQESVVIAAQKLNTARQDLSINQQDLEQAKQKLQALKQQEELFKKMAAERMGWAEALATEGSLPYITKTANATKGNENLQNPSFQGALQGTEARVKALEEAVGKSDSQLFRTVVTLENQLMAAQTTATDKISAAGIKIQELGQTLATDTTLADAQLAVDQTKALADGLKEAMGQITTGNADQEAAKSSIEKAASDGKITADEMIKLSANLSTLVGGLQAGLSTSTENTAKLINQMFKFQSDQALMERTIKDLSGKFESIKRR